MHLNATRVWAKCGQTVKLRNMEISWADADTDLEFTEIVVASEGSTVRTPLFPDYEKRLREGWVIVANQLAFVADADARRRYFDRGADQPPWVEEFGENEIYIDSGMDFRDRTWRYAVLNTALDVVKRLLPEAAAISTWPVQAIVYINSSISTIDDDGTEATVGGVKFILLRPDEQGDQRAGLHRPKPTDLPVPAAAVFTTSLDSVGAPILDRPSK